MLYHSVWSSSCRFECSWAVSVQTRGSELHDKPQNGRLCTAVMPDTCQAHELICRNLYINKLCSNTSTGKDNVMAILEERSYSKVLSVWLPQMLEDSYKQIASDLLPRQNRKSRVFFRKLLRWLKFSLKYWIRIQAAIETKESNDIPNHQGIQERATSKKKIMFIVFVGWGVILVNCLPRTDNSKLWPLH